MIGCLLYKLIDKKPSVLNGKPRVFLTVIGFNRLPYRCYKTVYSSYLWPLSSNETGENLRVWGKTMISFYFYPYTQFAFSKIDEFKQPKTQNTKAHNTPKHFCVVYHGPPVHDKIPNPISGSIVLAEE